MCFYHLNIFKVSHTIPQNFCSTPPSNGFKHVYNILHPSTLPAAYLLILYYDLDRSPCIFFPIIPRNIIFILKFYNKN